MTHLPLRVVVSLESPGFLSTLQNLKKLKLDRGFSGSTGRRSETPGCRSGGDGSTFENAWKFPEREREKSPSFLNANQKVKFLFIRSGRWLKID